MNFSCALLGAYCVLVFSRVALASNFIACKLPQNFTLQISKNHRATFYESDLTILVDYDAMTLTSYKETNSLNVQANNVVVNFNGIMYMESDDPEQKISKEPEVLSRTYNDRILGVARRETPGSSVIELPFEGCRIVLLSNEMDRPETTGRIANEIHRLAESCIELELCQNVDKIKTQFTTTVPVDNASDLMFACPDPLVIATENCEEFVDSDIVRAIANKAVDVALDQVSENLKATNGGTIPIPDVEKEFSTGSGIFRTDGHFKATNGTFRDLTTIWRVSDVFISHVGMKVNVACEFGLEVADLTYPHYELKYGIIQGSGMLSGSVYHSALSVRVTVDYNSKPCRISMDHLKVTKLGNMRIELTGLGGLNWLVTKLLNWITIQWREQIVVSLEQRLLQSVHEQLSNFDCEKYRP